MFAILEAFATLVERGTMSEEAIRSNLTQSAISECIALVGSVL